MECKKLSEKCLCIYEPFNSEVIGDILVHGRHLHDRVGEIRHDYEKLPRHILYSILYNADWIEEWRHGSKPYLGDWRKILEQLDSLGVPVVLKDVYAWPLLPEIRISFPSSYIVCPVRGDVYVFTSFVRWLRERREYIDIKKRVRERGITVNPMRIIRYLIRRYRLKKSISPEFMMGLGDFYRYMFCSLGLDSLYREQVAVLKHEPLIEVLRRYFSATYGLYKMYAESWASYTVRFDDKLDQEKIGEFKMKIREQIKDSQAVDLL